MDEVIRTKYNENEKQFVHSPNLQEMARDVISIGGSICDLTHSNGIACEWGGAFIA